MIPPDSGVHDGEHDDAAAYALGSLDPAERAAFELHLAGCDRCAVEVRSFQRVAAALAQGVPLRTPPTELRRRVLAWVAGFPGSSVGLPPGRESLRRWLPIAAAVVAAVGAAFYAGRLHTRVSDLEDRLEQAQLQGSAAGRTIAEARRVSAELQSAMGVLSAPDLVRIDLGGQAPAPGANARALWSRTRGMVFTASSLPPLPPGRVYQVWVVTAQAPISAGLLSPDEAGSGQSFFDTPADIPPPTAVAVSIEPAGGVPAPTGAIYLAGTPS